MSATWIRLRIYLYFLLFFVPVHGQNCKNGENGTVCVYPNAMDLTLNSTTVIVSVSSICNTSVLLQNGGTLQCTGQVSSLYDKVAINLDGLSMTSGNYDTFWASDLTKINDVDYKEQSVLVNFTDLFLITSIEIAFGINKISSIDMTPTSMEIQGYNGGWKTWFNFGTDCTNKSPCKLKNTEIPSNSPVKFIPIETYGNDFFTNLTIQRLYTASALRIVLIKPPLSGPSFNETLSYFMISDISIIYRCACNGHSSTCGGAAGGTCNCEHFTAGNNCEMCAPAYNNVTWQMASSINPFQCQACDCNGRSKVCQYNAVDMSGDCTACENGTSGKYCQNCNTGYYLNPVGGVNISISGSCSGYDGFVTKSYNCSDICIPCNCSTIGSRNSSSCNYTGHCDCKTRVTGKTCDTCIDGSYNLSPSNYEGCAACECDSRGILSCDKTNATCLCKNNTSGTRCDVCKPTYYNLDGNNPAGCTECGCDRGASQGYVCDYMTGACVCKQYTTTRTCSSTFDGFFGPGLDYYTFEAEYSANVTTGDIVERVGGGSNGSTFTGRGFLGINSTKTLTFYVRVSTAAWYRFALRYESTLTFAVSATLLPTANITTLPTYYVCQNSTSTTLTGFITLSDRAGFIRLVGPMCLLSGVDYEFKLNLPVVPGLPGSGFLLDSVVLFPVVENLTSFITSDDSVKSQIRRCFESDMLVSDANRTILGCPAIDYSLMIDLYGMAYACNCDPSGSYNQSCSPQGGQCPCKPNMLLRNCSQCAVNAYGFNAITGCLACNCHPNASLTLKCLENGTCICRANVTGDKCDRCIDKHFGLTTGNGCQPCLCSGSYVVNDSCLDSGQCFCKPGVSGIKCNTCAPGFYGLTTSGCTTCGCNTLGSSTSLCDTSNGKCQCKAKVTGFLCDSCIQEYFGLGPYSSDGCIQCYCSGMSKTCTSALGWYQAVSSSKLSFVTGINFNEFWMGVDQNGSSVAVDIGSLPGNDYAYWTITNYDVSTNPLYFVSPKICMPETCFNGYLASSYGQWLNITLAFNQYPPSSPSNGSLLPIFSYPQGDVVIRSSNVTYALVALLNITTSAATTYSIMMNENSWFKDSFPNHPTYGEMIQLLYNVQNISIRAKFSQANGSTASLISAVLGYGVKDSNFDRVPLSNIEQCVCPSPYEGQFCERCSAGYTKVNNSCVPCTCNGHNYPGTTCDPYTGKCNCVHNTTGDHCELCMPGSYGDATQGLPDSCKACFCPGNVYDPNALSHSSSRTCNTTGTSFICNCDESYTGSRCDVCSYGYYGVPTNGSCTACLCGGTNDCDNMTGVCRSCTGNTAGVNCSQCLPDYYNRNPNPNPYPYPMNCFACSCNKTGSSAPCSSLTGGCNCLLGVDDLANCSTCLPGHFNFTSSGCTPCGCNLNGIVNGNNSCTNGQCSCKQNFSGPKCDQCINEMHGNFCNASCSCLTNYTVNGNTSCSKDGQCQCLPGYGGHTCNTCIGDGSYAGITPQSAGIFPSCTYCGSCFTSLANEATSMNLNISRLNDLTLNFLGLIIDIEQISFLAPRVANVGIPINLSDLYAKRLVALKDNLTSINLYNVPAQLLSYASDLQSSKATQTNLTERASNLEAIDPNSIQTGDATYPSISIPNFNGTFHAIVDSQRNLFNQGTAAYNIILSLDALVQNQTYSVDLLRSRVEAVTATMGQANATIYNSIGQMNGIDIPSLQSRLNNDDRRTKATQNLVNSLNSDIAIAQFYLASTQTVHDFAKQRLDAFVNQYNVWNQQLSATGSLQNFSDVDLLSAQNAANSAINYCNLTQSMNSSVTNAIVNLWNARRQMETSNLIDSINTIQLINSINLDQYSNQIVPVITSINSISVQPDLITNLSRYSDNSSAIAQNLINIIQDAVNKTQQTQSKLNQLLSNMNSSSYMDSQSKICLNSNAAQTTSISTNLDSVTRKANETRVAAAFTSQAMANATAMFDPVRANFANVTSTITTARNNLILVNNTLDAVQTNELKNTNSMVLLDSSYSNRLAEYSTWLTTKTQVDVCLNDLWSSFNFINTPVRLTDLASQTQDQLNQIAQLTNDINSLQSEINVLLSSIDSLGTSNVACTESTSG